LLRFWRRIMSQRWDVLGVNIFGLRIHQGRLNGNEQRSQCCEQKQRA